MMGATHAAIGFTVGLGVGLVTQNTFSGSIGLAFVGGVAALLPDIDHPSSIVRQKLGRIGHIGLFWLPHRGVTHTLLFTLLIALLSIFLTTAPVQWVIPVAYLSHLLADALTRRGIPLFWPFRKRTFHILPRRLRITSGGRVEAVIATLNLVLIVTLIFAGQYA